MKIPEINKQLQEQFDKIHDDIEYLKDHGGGGGGGGYVRPAHTNREFIGLIQEGESFAHYNPFAQFDGDVMTYANAYQIDEPVTVYSIDRNFSIVYQPTGIIETYWQRERTRELNLHDTWTAGGYSAFDHTGIEGNLNDIIAIKEANALLSTGIERMSEIPEALTATSDLGEFVSKKADKVYIPGKTWGLRDQDINDGAINLGGMTIVINSNNEGYPVTTGNPSGMFANMFAIAKDRNGNIITGLMHFDYDKDHGFTDNFVGHEQLEDQGLYFFEIDAFTMTIDKLEMLYTPSTGWHGGGGIYRYTLHTDKTWTGPMFPTRNSPSSVFLSRENRVAEPEKVFNLKDVIQPREPGRAELLDYIQSGNDISNYQIRYMVAGDILHHENYWGPPTGPFMGPGITDSVWVYSLDKQFVLHCVPDGSLDVMFGGEVLWHNESIGASWEGTGFSAFDAYGIFGKEEDIQLIKDRSCLTLDWGAYILGTNDVLTAVSDAATESSFRVNCIFKDSGMGRIAQLISNLPKQTLRVMLKQGDTDFPDGPHGIETPRPRQYFVDNWTTPNNLVNPQRDEHHHLLYAEDGIWKNSDIYPTWVSLSGDTENKANKVIVDFPPKALRDVQYNETIGNKKITLKEMSYPSHGTPYMFQNTIGGTYIVDPEDGRPAIWMLIHYSEADDRPSQFFDVPFGGGQPPLVDNGIYSIIVHFVGDDYHPEYEILRTLYNGQWWFFLDCMVPDEYIQNNLSPESFTSNIFNNGESMIQLGQQKLDLKDALFIRQAIDNKNLISEIKNGSNVANYNPLCLYAGDQLTINNFDWHINKPVRIYSIDKDFYIRFSPTTGGGADAQHVDFVFNDNVQIGFYSAPNSWTAIGFSAMDYTGIIGEDADIQELISRNAIFVTGPMKMVTTADILTSISDTASRASKTLQVKPAANYPTIARFTPNVENAVWRINKPTFSDAGLPDDILYIEAWLETNGTVTRFIHTGATGDYVSKNNGPFYPTSESANTRYISGNAAGTAQYSSLSALNSGPWFYRGQSISPVETDYALYVNEAGKQCHAVYDGAQWNFTYVVNDTPFSAAQLAAINSGASTQKFANIQSDLDELIGRTADLDLVVQQNASAISSLEDRTVDGVRVNSSNNIEATVYMTRAQLDAKKAAGQLVPGQWIITTDE